MNTLFNRLATSFMAGLCRFSQTRALRGTLLAQRLNKQTTAPVIDLCEHRAAEQETDCEVEASDPTRDVAA